MLTITTSWDDGHPLDLRIADLLSKHGLRGTFYVPFENTLPVLSSSQIRDLSQTFEIGGHTVHHAELTAISKNSARAEIVMSKARLEDITGMPCKVFCFPKGRFRSAHIAMVAEAGFAGVRTVELMSLDYPRVISGTALIPTTIQAYPQSTAVYLRNATKRLRFRGVWNGLAFGRGRNWGHSAIAIARNFQNYRGVFHLWGHSWEIERNNQWGELDRVLAAIRQCCGSAVSVTNSALCAGKPMVSEIA